MVIRSLSSCEEFIAGDNTILRELFHPDKHDVSFRYSFAHAIVKPGDISHVHSLATSELYYILEGKGIMHIDDEKQEVLPGDAVYIPPHAKQCIHNHGESDLIFLCIVDPAWRVEDETVYSKS
jgi:mannose-6-phosphate isomerase-like protein (cupin superfamily)